MASYVGRIILIVNGIPMAEAKSVNTRTSTGRKALKGMSLDGKPVGTVDGTYEYTLDCEFYIPKLGEKVNWDTLENAVFVIPARDGIGPIDLYTGVFCMENSGTYGESDEATRKVTLGALNKVNIGLGAR